METFDTPSPRKKLVMWCKITELFSHGQTKSQISRNLGISRARVRRYLSMSYEEFTSSDAYRRVYDHKLDCYEQFILDELRFCPSYSSKQIEDHLHERYGSAMKGVCSKTIYNYVVHLRAKYNIPKFDKPPRAYEKLPELPYGEYGQADFGEFWMKRSDGRQLKVYFFVLVLSRSRYKYVYFSRQPFTTALAVYAHELAFSYYGGRPKRILYDQDKVLLHTENLGDLILTKGFRSFVEQQHFEPVFCRKSDPESKGKVENVVKYVKQNFLHGRVFEDIDHLNEECISWLERTGNGSMHHGIYRIPSEEFAIEQAYLHPYYGVPSLPSIELKEYAVRKDNTINYHSCYYTVPSGTYRHAGTQVMVEESDGKVHIYSKETGKVLAIHPLAEVRGSLVANPEHKPIRGVGITDKELEIHKYLGYTDALSIFLSNLASTKPRYYSKNLTYLTHKMYEYKVDILQEALVRCITSKAYNAGVLIEVAETLRLKEGHSLLVTSKPAVPIPAHLHSIQPQKTSLESFNQFFS